MLDFRNGLAIEPEKFRRTVNYGGKLIQNAFVAERLDDDLVSYSVRITLGDTDYYFIIFRHNIYISVCSVIT